MAYTVAAIQPGIWALARWDETWSSFNNLYLVDGAEGWTAIDTGKSEHGAELLDALAGLGIEPGQVRHLLLTHGHRDHVGARSLFPEARWWLHPLDRPLVSEEAAFHDLPDHGDILGFECRLLGHHTPGSVALYHRESGLLVGADHLPFFGHPLGEEGLVGTHAALRASALEFVRAWSQDAESRTKHRFDQFREGLALLGSYRQARVFATGHGAVLSGEIPAFFDALLAAGV
jgi:glyoxylase-like metal-dependent hydrolase (beta-lactamase superfamily II)